MAIHITKWQPDTCGCTIEYSWDDTTNETSRVHNLDNYVIKCTAHQSLATDTDRWNCVLNENPRKGNSLLLCFDNVAALFDTDATTGTRTIKKNIIFNWSWTGTAPNRVLNISFTGITLTTNQKNTIQSIINTKFGSGKVVIS